VNDQDSKSRQSSRTSRPAVVARNEVPARERLGGLSLDRAGDAVYWVDSAGRLVYANAAAARLLGYGGDELAALSLADVDPGMAPEGWPDVWAAVKSGQASTFETTYRTKSGRLIPVEVSTCFLSDGERELVCGFVRDLSERRRSEETLKAAKEEAERVSAAKTRFLAAASHDLRQPLHAMELLVSALSGQPQSAEGQSILSDMQDSLTFARRMLDSLLDVSELEAGTITPHVEDVPLAPLLRRVHQQYLGIAREKGLGLRLVPSSLAVRSDPGLLERILDNLVSNAVRYTDRGRVLIGCRRRGDAVRLEVWDSGPGIAEAEQSKIFDDFYQIDGSAKERGAGLGLGLGLVRRLARLLKHEVGLHSEPGRGSVFRVALQPAARAAASEAARADRAGDASAQDGATIMIIEDDDMVLNAMRIVLESWGYRVLALASAEAARAAESIPDLVIADYRLPGGETGDRAIEELRERMGRDLPGIIVTGEVIPPEWADFSDRNLHVMKKPVRPAKLRALIRHLQQDQA